jgi:hypothetical protein
MIDREPVTPVTSGSVYYINRRDVAFYENTDHLNELETELENL